jgi:hypothetical protein
MICLGGISAAICEMRFILFLINKRLIVNIGLIPFVQTFVDCWARFSK